MRKDLLAAIVASCLFIAVFVRDRGYDESAWVNLTYLELMDGEGAWFYDRTTQRNWDSLGSTLAMIWGLLYCWRRLIAWSNANDGQEG
jgi:hypothetical protein